MGGFFGRPGNDQGCAGLIDQDAVHLVHDGVVQIFLDQAFGIEFHVVAQVVEPELVVRAVSNVRAVGFQPLFIGQTVQNGSHRHTQKIEDLPHPLGVASGQIVVDRHDVHASAGEGVQVGRQRGHERLAFTGFHFGDAATVQKHSADELHIEVAHLKRSHRRFSHRCKCLRQQIVQIFALGQTLFKSGCLPLELFIAHGFYLRLQRIDGIHNGLESFQFAFIFAPENPGE